MTEILTATDIAEIIGWFAGSFAVGFVAGRMQRVFAQLGDKL